MRERPALGGLDRLSRALFWFAMVLVVALLVDQCHRTAVLPPPALTSYRTP